MSELFQRIAGCVAGLMVLAWIGTAAAAEQPAPTYLRCEYRVHPLAIEHSQPRLSWITETAQRNWKQSAYQVQVASSPEKLAAGQADLWDTGKVMSDASAQIAYAGKTLTSRQRCCWRVRTWDGQGRVGAWSKPARWTMGLLKPENWSGAKWIGFDRPRKELKVDKGRLFLPPARYLRKRFMLDKKPVRATLYATALGLYEPVLNGRKVGENFFEPGWTDYTIRVHYRAYDVTDRVQTGANALGAILANGWYAGYVGWKRARCLYGQDPRFMAVLVVDYADGTHRSIRTDDTWRAATGPILEAELLHGETYDARKEQTGWAEASFDAANWSPVDVGITMRRRTADGRQVPATPKLCASPHQPVGVFTEHKALAITQPKPGMYVLNLGTNFAGFARIKTRAPAGTKIVLRFGERLNEDGTVYTKNLRGARATDTYISRGGAQTWQPRFTYHGFQYVEVTGWVGPFDADSVVGVELTSQTPVVGHFACSDPRVNQLEHNIAQTQRANFIDIPTDCPQRDERLGWTGDARAYVHTATYHTDVSAFYTKWLTDLADAQGPQGWFPKTAPSRSAGGDGGPAWADAGILCPWVIYRVYNDRRLLQRQYASMARFVQFRLNQTTDLRPPKRFHCYGDWLSVKANTPKEVIYTAYFARSAQLMARMAAVLGKADDARKYADLFKRIKAVFNKDYVDADGRIRGDTQTDYVLAITFGLVEGKALQQAEEHLVERIKARDWHLSTGFVGTPNLLPVLTKIGRTDVAYRLFLTDTYPSWLFPVKNGATSMWERWNSWTPENKFGNAGMNSFSHYSYGAVGRWMYGTIGGIDTDGPGYAKVIIRPEPGGTLTEANVHYDSIRGRIASHWKRTGKQLTMDVTIPANVTATVYVPAAEATKVTESGRPAARAEGVKFDGAANGKAVFTVGSGVYHFGSTMP